MKNLSLPIAKFIAAAACALTLGSCSRAEYAMLPKAGSYHGVTRAATPVPAAPQSTASVVAPAAPEAVISEAALATPAATTAPASTQALVKKKVVAASAAPKVAQPAKAAATAAPKLNAFQRLALNKVTRKVDKLLQKSGSARQHDNTASTSKTSAISGNLRTGIILLLVGLLVSLLSGISGIFGLIGGIIAVIGVIFIVLWLLDSL